MMPIGRTVRNIGLGSLLLLGGLTGRVNAQEPPVDCQKPTTQMAMNICAGRAAQESDRKLNIAYNQVRQSYQSSDSKHRDLRLKSLTTAQLAWIQYRDTTCKWKASKYSGGSIAPMIYGGCIDELTKQRTQELLSDLNDG
jgi:uncharacterized protein YecT (DUF1311 family)